jgi:hypothetical protein
MPISNWKEAVSQMLPVQRLDVPYYISPTNISSHLHKGIIVKTSRMIVYTPV